MPELDDDGFLSIGALNIGKTYIGTRTCPDETSLHGIFQNVDPLIRLEINAARRDVQHGADPLLTIFDRRLASEQTGSTRLEELLLPCLGRIAAGNCPLYPPGS
jgi:hypothetical protein